MMAFFFTTWNQGELFDYRNVLLRQGKQTKNKMITSKFDSIYEIFVKKEAAFMNRPESDKWKWWESPFFNVCNEEKTLLEKDRKDRISFIYDKFFSFSDIIFLQELNNFEDINFLKEKLPFNFGCAYSTEFHRYKGERTDTVVVWNTNRFKASQEALDKIAQSMYERVSTKRRITPVVLEDVKTQKIFNVVSCHLDGFNLIDPQQKNTSLGDKTINEALDYCKKCSADVSIIAGDFNSEFFTGYESKENYLRDSEKYQLSQRRFEILKDAGFNRVYNDRKTAYNSDICHMPGRESGLAALDHVFVKGDISPKLKTAELLPLEDITANPSDHCPLVVES